MIVPFIREAFLKAERNARRRIIEAIPESG